MEFEYVKVETTECAEGVFHIFYFGSYTPQKWLSESWFEITGSDKYIKNNVDIRQIKNRYGQQTKLANYVINQYIVSQTDDSRIFQHNLDFQILGIGVLERLLYNRNILRI